MASVPASGARQRVPAAERRDALIDAAIQEFAQTGLHGTPVDRIARRVGVAQPYVFSLFPTKRDLFIAAAERCFERVTVMFEEVAAAYDPAIAEPGVDVLATVGMAYQGLLGHDETLLRLQLHGYAACADPVIRDHIRMAFTQLLARVQRATGAPAEQIDEFIRYGMWINVAAALDVSTLSKDCDSITEQLLRDAGADADGVGDQPGESAQA
jgi:AcrR family transcriptional regulator